MNNQVVMDNFFELYKSELHRLGLLHKPDHIFNVDESGIDLNARTKKVIMDKKFKHAYWKQKAPRDHIKTMVIIIMIISLKNWPSGPYSRNGVKGTFSGKKVFWKSSSPSTYFIDSRWLWLPINKPHCFKGNWRKYINSFTSTSYN